MTRDCPQCVDARPDTPCVGCGDRGLDAWLVANVQGPVDLRCAEITTQLVAAYPTLTRHRGTVFVGFGFTRTHWWCQDGAVIVDPTVRQFDQWAGVLSYEEFIPDARGEPTGKCPDCGELVYGDTFCDATCAARTLAYLNARSPVL